MERNQAHRARVCMSHARRWRRTGPWRPGLLATTTCLWYPRRKEVSGGAGVTAKPCVLSKDTWQRMLASSQRASLSEASLFPGTLGSARCGQIVGELGGQGSVYGSTFWKWPLVSVHTPSRPWSPHAPDSEMEWEDPSNGNGWSVSRRSERVRTGRSLDRRDGHSMLASP